MKKARF